MRFFTKIVEFTKTALVGLWEGGGFLGRILAIILGIIAAIILFVIWLVVLTFEFGLRIIKIFVEEVLFLIYKIADCLTILNDILDEFLKKRIAYYILWLIDKILKTSFNSPKQVLSPGLLLQFVKNTFYLILYFVGLILFLSISLSYPIYTILCMVGYASKSWTIVLVTRILLLTPIVSRFIRLYGSGVISFSDIFNFTSPFWVFGGFSSTFRFRKRHIVYIIATLLIGTGLFYYLFYWKGFSVEKNVVLVEDNDSSKQKITIIPKKDTIVLPKKKEEKLSNDTIRKIIANEVKYHIIQKGETLKDITKRYSVNEYQLKKYNKSIVTQTCDKYGLIYTCGKTHKQHKKTCKYHNGKCISFKEVIDLKPGNQIIIPEKKVDKK